MTTVAYGYDCHTSRLIRKCPKGTSASGFRRTKKLKGLCSIVSVDHTLLLRREIWPGTVSLFLIRGSVFLLFSMTLQRASVPGSFSKGFVSATVSFRHGFDM